MGHPELFVYSTFFIVKAGTSKSEDDVEFQFDLDGVDFSADNRTAEFIRVNNSLIVNSKKIVDNDNVVIKENKTNAKPNNISSVNKETDKSNKTSSKSKSKKEDKEPYQYMIATDSNRLALMVYARDPEEFHKTYEKRVNSFLQKQGFGGYVFWNQPVPIYQAQDCHYPTDQELQVRRSLKQGGIDAGTVAAAGGPVAPPNSAVASPQEISNRLSQEFPINSQQVPLRLAQFRLPPATSSLNSFRYIDQQPQPQSQLGGLAAPQAVAAFPQVLAPPLFNQQPLQTNFGAVQQQQQQSYSFLNSLQYIPTDVLKRIFGG